MKITLRSEGDHVLLIIDGNLVWNLKWENARDVHSALGQKIKQSEEYAKANQVIYDQAIMQRSGSPVGLTATPILQQEAAKEAAWNTDLRRKLRPLKGVASQEIVSTPKLMRWSDVDALPEHQKLAWLRSRYPNLNIEVK